ncbi:hypothetical protein [Desulfospira joergensenii]|uniref:hypothetical protein n=1 Tax=Desulfospira joergensenii TaxID=53329 RepID=UPI0003B77C1E|nr:hypothetical protein [Desulfospira joergensenii]
MAAKKIIGTILLILNTAGLGFVVYMTCMVLVERFSPTENSEELSLPEDPKGKKPLIIEEDIPEDDDLLKDMDLSDLDDLNLDDFD